MEIAEQTYYRWRKEYGRLGISNAKRLKALEKKMRDEFINLNTFKTKTEAEVLTKRWIWHYNNEKPHRSLKYYTPAAYQTLMTNTTNKLIMKVD